MIAIAGDHTVLARRQRGLNTDRDSFLTNIQVTKPANQPESVKLARLFFKPADQQHLPIIFQQLFLACRVILRGIG